MQPSQPLVPLQDLPQALWVVASTTPTPSKQYGPEWPLAYRFGFAKPLYAEQIASLVHYLLEKPSIDSVRLHQLNKPDEVPLLEMTTSVRMTNVDTATQVFEVLVASPLQHRCAVREIKEVVRPQCAYTALVVRSTYKLAGNTGLVWVAVRDELPDLERLRLCNQLQKFTKVHSAVVRGTSTFELRVDYPLVKKFDLLVRSLVVLGIYPDFLAEVGATTFEKAINQKAGL